MTDRPIEQPPARKFKHQQAALEQTIELIENMPGFLATTNQLRKLRLRMSTFAARDIAVGVALNTRLRLPQPIEHIELGSIVREIMAEVDQKYPMPRENVAANIETVQEETT